MKQQSITSLPPSPDQERRARMLKYTIAMTIRVGCIFAMLFAQGWWLVVFAAGAIFLPYVAVVLANAQGSGRAGQIVSPDRALPAAPTRYDAADGRAEGGAHGGGTDGGAQPGGEDRGDGGPDSPRGGVA